MRITGNHRTVKLEKKVLCEQFFPRLVHYIKLTTSDLYRRRWPTVGVCLCVNVCVCACYNAAHIKRPQHTPWAVEVWIISKSGKQMNQGRRCADKPGWVGRTLLSVTLTVCRPTKDLFERPVWGITSTSDRWWGHLRGMFKVSITVSIDNQL